VSDRGKGAEKLGRRWGARRGDMEREGKGKRREGKGRVKERKESLKKREV